MINKQSILLLKRQVNEGSIFIDEYSDNFMLKMHTSEGDYEFYTIQPQFTGYFSPEIIEEKECYAFCHGQLTLNGPEIIRCEPTPAKLKKVSSCKYFDIEIYGDDLLSTIFFINFHYGKKQFGRNVSYVNYLLEIVMQLVEKVNIKEEIILKAALLYDLADTTHVKLESIEMQFGSQIRAIVENLGRLNCQSYNDKELMIIVNELGEKACHIELAILITNLGYIRNSKESQQAHYEWYDQLADSCKKFSPILHHFYMIERTKFS